MFLKSLSCGVNVLMSRGNPITWNFINMFCHEKSVMLNWQLIASLPINEKYSEVAAISLMS